MDLGFGTPRDSARATNPTIPSKTPLNIPIPTIDLHFRAGTLPTDPCPRRKSPSSVKLPAKNSDSYTLQSEKSFRGSTVDQLITVARTAVQCPDRSGHHAFYLRKGVGVLTRCSFRGERVLAEVTSELGRGRDDRSSNADVDPFAHGPLFALHVSGSE